MQNLTVQKVVLILISLAFFVAAPWLTMATLGGNSLPLLAIVGTLFLLFFLYGAKERCWLIIPFCLPIEGNLNFLPLNFSVQELAIVALFGYLLMRMIFGLDVGWKLGPSILWIPLACVVGVLLYHWIRSGDIGIKLLGGSGWGGRKYFKVAIAVLVVPLLASYPGIQWKDLQKVPLFYFLGNFVDIIPDTLTTFVPATAPLIWRVYSGVNLTEYGSTLAGNFSGETAVSRIGTLARFGTACALLILSYNPASTWLSPTKIWIVPSLLLSAILTAIAGFRSMVVRLFLSSFTAFYATARSGAFLIAFVGVLLGFGLVLMQGKVFDFPLSMQRALCFLPGDWDPKAALEAKASSEWRDRMKTLFYKDYFHRAPILGQGYHFNPSFAQQATDIYQHVLAAMENRGDEYADVRNFIEMRQPHEGPLHLLLVVGMVGALFFTLYCAGILFYTFRQMNATPVSLVTPFQIWSSATLVPQIIGFYFLFGDMSSFFIGVCPIITLLTVHERLRRQRAFANAKSTAQSALPNPPDLLTPSAV
jgi:hypothetical protein